MNKAANTYWTDDRLSAQRPIARPMTIEASARAISRELVGTRTEVRRRGGVVPSWTIFTMIFFASCALCLTVTMRTHAEMHMAAQKLDQSNANVETLRDTNLSLRREVERLRSDPRAIEAAARTRLNMVRANEIIVPAE